MENNTCNSGTLGIASASVTVAFVSVLPFLFPIASVGLALRLIWSGWKLSQTTTVSLEL